MTWNRYKQSTSPRCAAQRLLVMLIIAIAVTSFVAGCSAATRHRIKTIVFTGVPPLHGQESTAGAEQAETPQSAAAEQMARQQRHREALVSRYWQHGPFAAGECGRCHSLGQSTSFLGNRDATNLSATSLSTVSASSRLTMPPQELCITCHAQHGSSFAEDRGLQQHPPSASGACTGCHSPHQSLRQYMLLKADNHELCGSCHDTAILTPVHSEDPQQDCVNCHNAHLGTSSKLLRSDAQELKLLYGRGIDD